MITPKNFVCSTLLILFLSMLIEKPSRFIFFLAGLSCALPLSFEGKLSKQFDTSQICVFHTNGDRWTKTYLQRFDRK